VLDGKPEPENRLAGIIGHDHFPIFVSQELWVRRFQHFARRVERLFVGFVYISEFGPPLSGKS
jgi:hypothetical protein